MWEETKGWGNLGTKDKSMLLMWVCLGEHVMSYCFGLYRDWEIEMKGKPNKWGIEQAPIETILRFFEIIFDFGLFVWIGFTLFSDETTEQFHNMPLINYWLIIDMFIMFLTLPYTYLSKFMMLNGEITKNVFTLYQVQKKKLK